MTPRQQRADISATQVDRLPPHSIEAEQGVLGCCLLAPAETMRTARTTLCERGGEEFYDLKHRTIWRTLCALDEAGETFDLITLQARLRDHGHLANAGGLEYLSTLPDCVPSAANLAYYLDIVIEKFALRRLVAGCTEVIRRAYDFQGEVSVLLDELERDLVQLARQNVRRKEAVEEIYVSPADIEEEHWQRWFGKARGVPGLALPEGAFGDFPFLIRLGELTYIDAETKMGKSTISSYIALHMIHHGLRVVMDSREIKRVETLKKMTNQLLGANELPICQAGEQQIEESEGNALAFACNCGVCAASKQQWVGAMGWFQGKLLINRRVGIKHWRDIIEANYRLAEAGWNFFVFDNFGKYGIPNDDYAQQGALIDALCSFAKDTNSHAWLINHRNKASDGDYRKKAAGAHQILDGPDNLCSITKNENKWKKLFPYIDDLKAGSLTHDDFMMETAELRAEWDAKFYVNAQRLDVTRGNAARELWFLTKAGQYFDHRHARPEQAVNWLAKWTARKPGQPRLDQP